MRETYVPHRQQKGTYLGKSVAIPFSIHRETFRSEVHS